MSCFRNVFKTTPISPSRSVYGVDNNNNIIVPIDLVILKLSAGTIPIFDSSLPLQLTGADIWLNGGGVIGTVMPTSIPSPISVNPIVKLSNNGSVTFTPRNSILATDVLLPGESIFLENSHGIIIGGKLNTTSPVSGLPYLDGSYSVEAFQVTFFSSLNSRDIGSMVMVPRLSKSLGMYLGPSSGTPIVFPAFNI